MFLKRLTGFSLFLLFLKVSFSWANHLPVWEIHGGLLAVQQPHYRGSNSTSTRAFPFPVFVYRGERLKASDGEVKGLLYTSETTEFGVSLAASLPSSPNDNSARKGMPRLDATFEIGPSLTTRLWLSKSRNTNLSMELPVRAAFSIDTNNLATRNRGWTFAPSLNINHEYNNWKGELSLGPIFATRRYHRYFYDVPVKYVTPERSTYSASGGYSGSRVTFSIDKHFGQLSLISFIRYDILSNATFIDSPLVERSNNLSGGLAVMWQITKSERAAGHSHSTQ